MAATFIPDAVRVERYPPPLRMVLPAGHDTGFIKDGVIYASDVQIIRLAMGDPSEALDMDLAEMDSANPAWPTVTILAIP